MATGRQSRAQYLNERVAQLSGLSVADAIASRVPGNKGVDVKLRGTDLKYLVQVGLVRLEQ